MSGPVLNVRIDTKICQGTGYCARLAPAIFEVGDEVGRVIDASPDADHEALVEEAATLCPTRAITY